MPKKIISLALSQEAINKVDSTSKALGMSRSEYIEMMIKKGFHFSDEVMQISKLQEKIKEKIEGGSESY
jgi:metal-responsive CopG/Arc/MetJ family transcriptional regulator